MLITDPRAIGDKLLAARKRRGLTQAELAEKAGLADRTYADIERGESMMRVNTLMSICQVLRITPNDILTEDMHDQPDAEQIMALLKDRPPRDRGIIFQLIQLLLSYKDDI